MSWNTCLHLTPLPVFLLELPLSAISSPPPASSLMNGESCKLTGLFSPQTWEGREARLGPHRPKTQANGQQNLQNPITAGQYKHFFNFFYFAFEPSVFKSSGPSQLEATAIKSLCQVRSYSSDIKGHARFHHSCPPQALISPLFSFLAS